MRCPLALTLATVAATALAAGCTPPPANRPALGAIAGLARDHDSGAPIVHAEIRVRAEGVMQPFAATTDAAGHFAVERLRPGTYSLTATYASQPITVEHVVVPPGDTAVVDLTFTPSAPAPVAIDFGDPRDGAITHYRPPNHDGTSVLEGIVVDASSRERVAGAVVTAVRSTVAQDTQQTVTDDQGRFRFDPVAPGAYVVSSYYSIGGRGQIELRRDVTVAGGEAAVVPLWIEIAHP